MKACFRPLTITIALLLLSAPTRAAGETLRLTLPEAVALAVASHPDLALSRLQEQSAAIAVEAARGIGGMLDISGVVNPAVCSPSPPSSPAPSASSSASIRPARPPTSTPSRRCATSRHIKNPPFVKGG